jgi:hypothetical protein
MSTPTSFLRHSLRNQLFVLAGATFLLCSVVIILFFPLLNFTLTGLQDRTLKVMQEGAETEATTIARLLVMEFSSFKGLLQVSPTVDSPTDAKIKDLLWEKVTFNEIIEGIELIQSRADRRQRHLTYLFYRREAKGLKPMAGPQKVLKSFTGLEGDLIRSVNEQERVDTTLQESVNRGPKPEGEMLLRYMPVYVLSAEEGAVFWGVAKIGIDTSRMRHLLFLQSEEQDRIRTAIWVEIILSLTISGLIAMSLIYFWVRFITEPLKNFSQIARDLSGTSPEEFDLWLENLKRVDLKGQAEVMALKEVLERLGAAVPKLGPRLVDGEARACLGQVLTRALPTLNGWLAAGPDTDAAGAPGQETPEAGHRRDQLQAQLAQFFDDLAHIWPESDDKWGEVDLTPALERVWRLVGLGLPAEVSGRLELAPVPRVWGAEAELGLAVLYLLNFSLELAEAGDELGLKAAPNSEGGVRLTVWVSGARRTPEECRSWLTPFTGPGGLDRSLAPALAAAIAAQHRGGFTIAPREAGGVAFYLVLPPMGAEHGPVI